MDGVKPATDTNEHTFFLCDFVDRRPVGFEAGV